MIRDELTYAVIGCAMQVHRKVGPGFQEVIYQRCLAIEFNKAKIEYVREKDHIIYYEGFEVGTRRADFVVKDCIMVEIKALMKLEDVHLVQGKNYLTAYNFNVGLLINFGGRSLEHKLLFRNF